MIGSSVSHYQILEKLGAGGMGVVYKARDTHLDRFVAIKILPPEKITDADRKRRFIQEAKSASALNHPHIITIYDIDSTDQVCFIAMEYVRGKNLSQMIPPNGMIAAEALNYAVQIADALAALHAKGIVHRDLKPTNVMIGDGAVAKVLDFGLCKLTERVAGEDLDTPSTVAQTADGVAVGTPAYMSPEQVEGRPVDARSDIFSFGILLYEMLTGRRPFQGGTRLAVASAILNREPVPITSINSATPSEIERTVARCLEKDPERRFQNAADLKVALEWLARDVESGRLHAFEPTGDVHSRKHSVTYALTLLSAILAIAGATIYWSRPKPQASPDLEMVTSDLGLTTNPALSPDGKLLAYASDRSGEGNLDIWLQQLAGGQPVRRTHDPTDEVSPAFSPDGSNIVFGRTGGGIFIMPALAGGERQVAPSGLEPRFSPDGTQVAYWVGDEGTLAASAKIFCSAPGRGAPRQVAAEFASARHPLWAPDGEHLLFQGARSSGDNPEWWVAPIAGGPAVNTGILLNLRKQGLSPMPGPGDWEGSHLAFSAYLQGSRHIWETTIRDPGFRFTGSVRQLTFGTGMEGEPSISLDGRIALAGWYHHISLWRLPLQKGEARPGSLERLSDTGAFETHPSLSADATKMTFLSRRSGSREVWIRDLERGGESELTIGAGDKSAPTMAPDGSLVAYSVVENDKPSIYVVPTDSSQPGGTRRVCENCGVPSDWTKDRGGIFYAAGVPQLVYRLDLASGVSVPILEHPTLGLDQPHVSPDNRWIVFVATISPNRTRIFLSPLGHVPATDPTQWIAVTDGNSRDDKPRWLGGDALIYYSDRDHFGCLWKQRLQPGSKQPIGAPSPVYHLHELRRSPRTLYRKDFEITAARDLVILNLVEASGNIWLTSLPPDR
jgi:eukaryotic-like serine/threonine-protein kinase